MSDGPTVDISGLDKAEVLATLYNAAAPHGKGFLEYDPVPMTVVRARAVIETRQDDVVFAEARVLGQLPEHEWMIRHRFVYLFGRPLHTDLFPDVIHVGWYDIKHGRGMAQYVLDVYRFTGDVNAPAIWQIHQEGVLRQAKEVWGLLHTDVREKHLDNSLREVVLGFSDVADRLRPILAKIIHPVGH